jgi:hypothetical protein
VRFIILEANKEPDMCKEVISIPTERKVVSRLCTLSHKIPAISLDKSAHHNDGEAKLGLIAQLPADSDVEVCGDGFDSRTVKVCHNGSYYFVFAEDLPT